MQKRRKSACFYLFQRHKSKSSQTKKVEFVDGCPTWILWPPLCGRWDGCAPCCSHEHRPSTIDVCYKVSLKTFIILYTNCRLFTRVSSPCVVLASDWLLTFSNMFSDLLQHSYHINTVDIKMLASDWLLNQEPALWCRHGYYTSPTILLS